MSASVDILNPERPKRIVIVASSRPSPSRPAGRSASGGPSWREGPSAVRRALFEAAQCARRLGSPDHDYYLATAARLGGNRACLAVARKPLKRSYHTLRELDEQALQPA